MAMTDADRRAYWRSNLRLMAILLTIWATVSLGMSILFVEQLNNITFADFKLGFWMGQQGSIITFVVLIGVYVWRMERLDAHYGLGDGNKANAESAAAAATAAADGENGGAS